MNTHRISRLEAIFSAIFNTTNGDPSGFSCSGFGDSYAPAPA